MRKRAGKRWRPANRAAAFNACAAVQLASRPQRLPAFARLNVNGPRIQRPQLPTRRFLHALLEDKAVLVKCYMAPLYRHPEGEPGRAVARLRSRPL